MPDSPQNRFLARKKAIQKQFWHDYPLGLFVFCPFPAVLAELERIDHMLIDIFHPSAGC